MKWISVKDKKPYHRQIVIAWVKNKEIPITASYHSDCCCEMWIKFTDKDEDVCSYEFDAVTHWLPFMEIVIQTAIGLKNEMD